MLQAIKLLHENTKARITTSDGETDYFEIRAGVLQGNEDETEGIQLKQSLTLILPTI